MRWGNCLIGAIRVAYRHKFDGKFIMRWVEWQKLIPHFAWYGRGRLYDFFPHKKILPSPLSKFIFLGKYRVRKFSQPNLNDKGILDGEDISVD